jgi:DeoR family transcriptional regulator of aga operon
MKDIKDQIEISTMDRRSQIVDKLNKHGTVSVQELSELFKVSGVTIRNDFAYLENKNLLYRTHGGAIKHTKVALDLAWTEKAQKNSEQKKRIGQNAAKLIQDGDTIILDSGTTTTEIARHLNGFQNFTVITHALNIASELVGLAGINIIVPGGIFRKNDFSLVGSQTEQNLRDYYADKLFLGVSGFDSTYGISTPSVSETRLNRVMMEIAQEVIVVADSSKFGKRCLAFISAIDKINKVVTDDEISEKDKQNLLAQNIELIIT